MLTKLGNIMKKIFLIIAGVFIISMCLCSLTSAGQLDGTYWILPNKEDAYGQISLGFYDGKVWDGALELPFLKYKSMKNIKGSIIFINYNSYGIMGYILTWGQANIEEGWLWANRYYKITLWSRGLLLSKNDGYFTLQSTNWIPKYYSDELAD